MTTETKKISATAHSIKSVTVFKASKAEVNRSFSLDLKAGQNKVQISDLSSLMDTESVRVSGLGEARLFDVVCTVEKRQGGELAADSSPEVIRLLNVEKKKLESKKRVMEHEANLLVSYANTIRGEHVDPSAMGEFLTSFVERGTDNLNAVAKIDAKIVYVDRAIAKEAAKAALKTGEANAQVTVVVVANQATTVELKLTYIVSGAHWQPAYELHATTDNGKPSSLVSLHYRARITQSTGEDWTNSALTLSTVASDTVAKSVPQLRVTKIQQREAKFSIFSQTGTNANNHNNYVNNAPTVSLFGQPSTSGPPQQQISPFGFQAASGGGSFGLFGAAAAPSGGGLFGGGAAPATASSAFGSNTAPASTGEFFGSGAAAPSTAFGASGGGLFGGGAAPATASSSFGNSTAPASTSGLFGSGAAAPSAAFGAFGSAPAAANTPAPPLPQQPDEDAFEEISGPGSFSEPTTVVTESPLSVSYSVEGESTIPSDGVAHQVSVAVLSFESKVTHVCCPKIEPLVYLQCQVKNTSDFRLLPGPVSVFLDDSYVSKTSIQDINPSDTFNCTLGTDPATRLSYSRTFKTVRNDAGTFAEVSNTTTYTNITTVHNKHRFPLSEIIIRDIIPLSDNRGVKVLLRKPDGLVDAADGQTLDLKKVTEGLKVRWSPRVDGKGGEKQGRFEFLLTVDAGAKVTVESEWEVKAPADLKWHETTVFD